MEETTEDSSLSVELIKSENDKKKYKVIQLENGLRVLLISDPYTANSKTDPELPLEDGDGDIENSEENDCPSAAAAGKEKMAAAALCIKVGSFCDPDSLPGLAHFLEHMVFMGNKKYPDENSLSAYLTKRGGSNNAFTDCEKTVFKMDIDPKFVQEGLDHFAQFFIAPLMKKEAMDREVKIVDSEFQHKVPNDNYRRMLIFQSLAKEGHPLRKFVCGNIQSLKEDPESMDIDVHSHVHEFWEKYYSAHNMTMAVQSPFSLDVLETWIRDIFSAIPNNGLTLPDFRNLDDEPFEMSSFNKIVKIIPVQKTHLLVISWSLPCLIEHYRTKPLAYIAWLVGHEGPGSIFTYLQKKVWALDIWAGANHYSVCSVFQVIMTLTNEGMEHLFDVLTSVFQYLAMLCQEGPQLRLYKEIKQIANIAFRFLEDTDPQDYVEALAMSMNYYQLEHYICGPYLFENYDENLIQDCMDKLTADKANITLMSSQFDPDAETYQEEPLTKALYRIEDIPEEWLQEWLNSEPNPAFHLPHENRFIPTDFTIKEPDVPESLYPVEHFEDDQMRLFYKKDNKFNVPKACVYIHLITPEIMKSAASAATSDLFIALLEQSLSEITHDATIASLSYTVSALSSGFAVGVYGFNQTIPVLLDIILDHFMALDPSDAMFESIKKDLSKDYYNSFVKVRGLGNELKWSLLQDKYYTSLEMHSSLQAVTRDDIQSFLHDCVSEMFIEALCQGNLTASESMDILWMVRSKLGCQPLPRELILRPRAVVLPEGNYICRVASFSCKEIHSKISNYYQIGVGDTAEFCFAELMMLFMSEPCFTMLRNKEQLGYSVGCQFYHIRRLMGYVVTVYSPADAYACSHIDCRIENFLTSFAEQVNDINDEEFQTCVASLIKLKSCEDLHLKEEADRNWGEIVGFEYRFDQLARDIEFLHSEATLDKFKEWCFSHLPSPTKKERKKLSMQIVGRGLKALEECREWMEDPSIARIPNGDENDADSSLDETATHEMIFLTSEDEVKDEGDATACYITDIEAFKAGLELHPPSDDNGGE